MKSKSKKRNKVTVVSDGWQTAMPVAVRGCLCIMKYEMENIMERCRLRKGADYQQSGKNFILRRESHA